jgi:hypothetical protein
MPLLDHFPYGKFTLLVLTCLLPIVTYISRYEEYFTVDIRDTYIFSDHNVF